MAHEFVQGTTLEVIQMSKKAATVKLMAAMPEGRRLSPAFLVALASIAGQCVGNLPGVGLDPLEAAILACHLSKDGSDEHQPEIAECWELLQSLDRKPSSCNM